MDERLLILSSNNSLHAALLLWFGTKKVNNSIRAYMAGLERHRGSKTIKETGTSCIRILPPSTAPAYVTEAARAATAGIVARTRAT